MAENEIVVDATPEQVFAVLSDPERYEDWVVGTSETRTVDPEWPDEGAKLRYETVGIGPLRIGDTTEVLESEPPRRLLLRARMRPLGGTVEIELTLEPVPRGGTRVRLREEPAGGVLEQAHNPVLDAALARRNEEALRRLKELAERRA